MDDEAVWEGAYPAAFWASEAEIFLGPLFTPRLDTKYRKVAQTQKLFVFWSNLNTAYEYMDTYIYIVFFLGLGR
jgi:hypothetical protein